MSELVQPLKEEIKRLRAAIRKHRDYRGDDRCHLDDAELYAVLPEGDTRPARSTAVTIENCQRFIECRQQGHEYVSPEREIERLLAALKFFAELDARIWVTADEHSLTRVVKETAQKVLNTSASVEEIQRTIGR